jgi:hypothetical protein
VREGVAFTALCGDVVTPYGGRGDLAAGPWFDREYPVPTGALAKAPGGLFGSSPTSLDDATAP